MQSKQNVILFPKLKLSLEEESLQALQEKKYSTALKKLNKLIHYDVTSHEIIFGKLICLVELGYYDEALELCEQQLQNRCSNYYDYVHLYLTILFQTGKYEKLMNQVEDELNDPRLSNTLKEQFQQLYQLSQKMNNDTIAEKTADHIHKLREAIHEKNDIQQWRRIRHLHKLNSEPTEEVILLLKNETVHPVTKTAIFNWLQDKKIQKDVHITKFNLQLTINPTKIASLKEHNNYQLGLELINKESQQNPTLTNLMEQLLYRYIFVRYPIVPKREEIDDIVAAIETIGRQTLHIIDNLEVSDQAEAYVEEIRLCETLYLTIIEE